MDKAVVKRLATVVVVGGIMLYLFYEPKEGNLVNDILEVMSKRVISSLGGIEEWAICL